jgi:hypothetical protein
MKLKIYILFILFILLVSTVLASQSLPGAYKQNTCINLLQHCANCSYVNLTSVIYPDSTFLLQGNFEMTKQDTVYNYTVCNTSQIGSYIYCVKGDPSGSLVTQCVDFEVNDRGVAVNDNTTNIAIIITLIIVILLGAFFTFYLDSGLKFPFFLGTVLATVFTLNVVSNIASNAGASENVVNLLWLGYRIGLYLFYALFLYVLIKLTTELKIRKNPVPTMGSPLKQARERRLIKQGRK